MDIETGYHAGGALWNEVIEEEDDAVDASIVVDVADASIVENLENDHSSFEGPEDLVEDVTTNGHSVKDLLGDSLPYHVNKESDEVIPENRTKDVSLETEKVPEPLFVDQLSSETSGYLHLTVTVFKASTFYN